MDDELPVIRQTKGGLLQVQPTRRNAITTRQVNLFLAELAQTANIRRAVRVADVNLSSVYHRKRRNPAFAAAWDKALAEAHEKLTAEMLSRALTPLPLPEPQTEGDDGIAEPAMPAMSDETRLRLLGLHARRVATHKAGEGIQGRIETERLRQMIAERLERLDRRLNGDAERAV